MSKISIRGQSLWSVTSAIERKLSLTFSVVFPGLSVDLSVNFEDSLGVGRAKEKALLINSEPQGARRGQTPLPQGPSSTGRWKPFTLHSPVFLFQGLTVAPLFCIPLISRRVTGETDTARTSMQCPAKVMGASLSSSIMSLVTIHKCVFCFLRS